MKMISSLWRVLQLGHSVANPAAWKKGQITGNAVVALLYAGANLATSFGFPIPASGEQIDAVGLGLFALVNIVLTVSTSNTVGLSPRDNPDSEAKAPPDGHTVARWGDDETQL